MSDATATDLLNAKLKLDISKFAPPIKTASDLLLKFKQSLDGLSSGSSTGGLRTIVQSIAAIGELSKRAFGNEVLTGIKAYNKEIQSLNKSTNNLNASLAQTVRLQRDVSAGQKRISGGAGGSSLLGVFTRAVETMRALGDATRRAFGTDGTSAIASYKRSIDSLNQSLNTTLRLTVSISAAQARQNAGGGGFTPGIPRAIPIALPVNPGQAEAQAANMAPAALAGGGSGLGIANAISSAAATATQHIQRMQAAGMRAAASLQAGFRNASQAMAGLGVAAGFASVKLISLASDANEASSKFGFVFKDAADKTGKALDDFSEKAGRSRYAMRNMAADIGALIQPMGFTREKTGELSTAVAKLAVDLSSFFNVSENDALIALKAGIVGESEPLRRLGVNLNEAKIQQEAFSLGIAKNKEEVNGAVKAQAILSLVFKETAQAQGDAIRTGDQFANSLRRTRDFIKDAATDLGQALIPAATRYIRAIGDASQPVAEWAKENQKVLEQRVDEFMERVSGFATKLSSAFMAVYESTARVRESLGGLGERLRGVVEKGKELFNGLPKWAQDLIMVSGAVTGLSIGLGTLGGSIPFVGQFIVAISNLINPVGILKGLFEFIYPLVTTLGSSLGTLVGLLLTPEAAVVGGVVAGIAALVLSVREAIKYSDEARESWDAIKDTFTLIKAHVTKFIDDALKVLSEWWVKNGEQIDRIQTKLGELVVKFGSLVVLVGEKLAGAFELITGTSLPLLIEGLKGLEGTFKALLDIAEAYVDFFSGDGRRSTVLFNAVIIELNKTLISTLETVGEIVGAFDKFAGTNFAGGIKKQINAIKMENGLRETANSTLSDSIADDDRKRAAVKAMGNAASGFGAGIGALAGGGKVDKEAIKEATKEQEKAKTEYKQQNASQVAQSDAKVANAESGAYNVDVTGGVEAGAGFKKPMTAKQKEAQKQKDQDLAAEGAKARAQASVGLYMPSEGVEVPSAEGFVGISSKKKQPRVGQVSLQTANKNLAGDIRQNKASDRSTLQDVRQNLQGQQGAQQQYQMIFQQLQKAQQLQAQALQEENAERRKALLEESDMRRQAANAMVQANQDGVKGVKGLAEAAKNAGVDMDKLDQAEKDRIAKENGQPTAAQQQAMQQQQQFAQQFQQGFMQAAQNAAQQQGQAMQEGAQAMLQQALGGPGEVQAMIDEASAKGDMKSAYALIRQRLEKQLAVSMSNLHNLASDPMAGGGFGPEHGGQSNDAYFMTLDIPLVRLIKFLQAQLNAIPKMAEGGVITKPTQLIAGENGPEAIIPLSAINTGPLSMLQQVLSGAFTGMRGGGLTAGMLGSFGSAFRNAQYWLSSAMDVGMPGAAAQLSRWAATQQSASSFLDNLYRYRRIDLSPGGYGTSYGPAFNPNSRMISSGGYSGMGNVVINATFHGTDFTNPSQVRQAANQLYDHLANAARARGRDMSGRDPLRAPTNAGAPNVNAVAAFRS